MCILHAGHILIAIKKLLIKVIVLLVGADGNPVRYQWGAYDGMRNERMIFYKIINMGGTAEVYYKLLSLFWGQKLFLFLCMKIYRINKAVLIHKTLYYMLRKY